MISTKVTKNKSTACFFKQYFFLYKRAWAVNVPIYLECKAPLPPFGLTDRSFHRFGDLSVISLPPNYLRVFTLKELESSDSFLEPKNESDGKFLFLAYVSKILHLYISVNYKAMLIMTTYIY